MRRYLVIAHRTLGGEHLLEHLHELRAEDPHCTFHLVVPLYHPRNRAWSEGEVRASAEEALHEVLDRMATMRMGATGEVGDANPVNAVNDVLLREGDDAFCGIVLSTLPPGTSQWLRLDVPSRMARAHPELPLTHLVAEEHIGAS